MKNATIKESQAITQVKISGCKDHVDQRSCSKGDHSLKPHPHANEVSDITGRSFPRSPRASEQQTINQCWGWADPWYLLHRPSEYTLTGQTMHNNTAEASSPCHKYLLLSSEPSLQGSWPSRRIQDYAHTAELCGKPIKTVVSVPNEHAAHTRYQ